MALFTRQWQYLAFTIGMSNVRKASESFGAWREKPLWS